MGQRVAKKLEQIPAVDGFRGIAITTVLLCHFTQPFYGKTALHARVYDFFDFFGPASVDLFFVLSGFLITSILLNSKDNPHRLGHFYARRFVRIFPLYYLALLCIFVLPKLYLNTYTPNYRLIQEHQWWLWSYLGNAVILKTGRLLPWVSYFWSLAVEEQFYLFWPVLVFGLSTSNLRRACLAAFIIAIGARIAFWAAGVPLPLAIPQTMCRVDDFGIGALIALYRREGNEPAYGNLTRILGVATLPSLLVLAAGSLLKAHHPSGALPFLILEKSALAVCCGYLIAKGLSTSDWRAKSVLESRFFTLTGKLCYGLYILHPLIAEIFNRFEVAPKLIRSVGYLPALFTYFSLGLGLSLFLAYLSWHLFEKHFLRLVPSSLTKRTAIKETELGSLRKAS